MTTVDTRTEVRRPDIEKWLDGHGVLWEFVDNFPLEQIDRVASRANQARSVGGGVHPETSTRYSECMKQGDEFPPLVGYRRSTNGRVVLVDGNHRHEAALEVGWSTFPMYVVSAPPDVLTTLTFQANVVLNGLTNSEEDRCRQAVHLVENEGRSHEEAAATTKITQGQVATACAEARAGRRAAALGIRGWDTLNKTARVHLGRIANDVVFELLARAAISDQLTAAEIDRMAAVAKKFGTERAQVEAISAELDARRVAAAKNNGRAKPVASKNPRALLGAHVSYIVKCDGDELIAACRTEDERQELIDHLLRLLASAPRLLDRLRLASA